MIFSMKDILKHAKDNNYAVGQFNMNNFQWVQVTLRAAEKEKSPVIIGTTDNIVDYLGGFNLIVTAVKKMIEEMNVTIPVVLHLDHAQDVERCKKAIDASYSSVMFDGSKLPLEKNIEFTKEVVDYARPRGVSVEAEIGSVGGNEDDLISEVIYADPQECLRLVEETQVDVLAAALGSVHGPYKGEPKPGFAEMEEISNLIDIPLALHGGSGIPKDQIWRSIKLSHAKINVNTECTLTGAHTLREILTYDQELYNPKTILEPALEAISDVVKEKIELFGSGKRARN